MSYILDALKRADAERSNATASAAPPTGTQAFTPAVSATNRRLHPGVLWLLGGLLLMAAATWWWRKERAPAPPAAPPETVAAVTPSMPRPAETTTLPKPEAPAPAPAVKPFVGPTQSAAPVLSPPPPPAQGPVRTETPSVAKGASLLPAQGRPVTPAPATPPGDAAATGEAAGAPATTGTMAPGAAPSPAAGVPAAPAPPPAMPVQPPPTTVNRTITAPSGPAGALASDAGLKVTGATYSENPAHRLLIVNGKVVKEGQEVEPGLVLEIISPRSAVFKRQGTRFNVNY